MINEIIDSVIKAEKKAEKIVAKASTDSKEIIVKAKEQCDDMIKKAREDVALKKEREFLSAENRGEDIAEELIERQNAEIDGFKVQIKDKTDEAIQFIVGRLLD